MHSGFILISLGRIRVYARNDDDQKDERYNEKHDKNVISRLGISARNGYALGILGSGALTYSRLLGLLGNDLAREHVSAVALANQTQNSVFCKIRYLIEISIVHNERGIFSARKNVIYAENYSLRRYEIVAL